MQVTAPLTPHDQQPPYPPLVEAAKRQAIFELHDVTGTLVGFRTPAFMRWLNVPGYHFHFLTDDRRAGGHVLDCQLRSGAMQVDRTGKFLMLLPERGEFGAADIAKDRDRELETVEQGPTK